MENSVLTVHVVQADELRFNDDESKFQRNEGSVKANMDFR